jgi:hypothetical protein
MMDFNNLSDILWPVYEALYNRSLANSNPVVIK